MKSALIGGVSALLWAGAAIAQPLNFDIPAGDLKTGLGAYATQSGAQLIYRPEDVARAGTQGVRGQLSAEDALRQLLRGTDLQVRRDPSGALAVVRRAPSPEREPVRRAPAPTATPAVAESVDVTQVEDIVVTAQRREESLQKVPIAISVLSSKEIEASGVGDTQALMTVVPGLNVTRFGAQASPYLRGVGSDIKLQGDENAVSIYIDGVLQISGNSALFSLSNISRIEVLKGPQGTLFGRNSAGGVISVTTLAPSQDPSFSASFGYGNYSTVESRLYANVGVTSTLATNLSFYGSDQKDGFGRAVTLGRPYYRTTQWIIRNQWQWEPTSELTLKVAGSYSEARDNSTAYHPGDGAIVQNGFTTPGFYNFAGNIDSYSDKKGWDVAFHASYDLGWARLVEIASYSHVKAFRPGDSDVTSLNTSYSQINTLDKGFTEELQLQSAPESPVTWIVGLYHLNATSGYPGPDGLSTYGTGLGVNQPQTTVAEINTKSYAGFAQATAEIFSRTNLTLGGRYTSDTKTLDNQRIVRFVAGPAFHQKETFNRFTYKATLDHHVSNDLMLYATYSTGFRAGQYSATSFGLPPVEPETVKAMEVGEKLSLFDRRLQINAAVYHYDYSNLQVSVAQAPPAGGVLTINAAKATFYGADIDVTAVPMRNLTLRAGLALNHARYDSFENAPYYFPRAGGGLTVAQGNAKGNVPLKAPAVAWSVGGDYRVPLSTGEIGASANFSYQSKFYWDFQNVYPEASRNLLAASVYWAPSSTFEVRFWGSNLLNERYNTYGKINAVGFVVSPSAPRTYGVRITAKL